MPLPAAARIICGSCRAIFIGDLSERLCARCAGREQADLVALCAPPVVQQPPQPVPDVASRRETTKPKFSGREGRLADRGADADSR